MDESLNLLFNLGWILLIILIIIYAVFFIAGAIPFTNNYMVKHQCDAEPYGFGDPNCYNYKDNFLGDWYPFEISKQIAERSGADMERFCNYHKQFGKECMEKNGGADVE